MVSEVAKSPRSPAKKAGLPYLQALKRDKKEAPSDAEVEPNEPEEAPKKKVTRVPIQLDSQSDVLPEWGKTAEQEQADEHAADGDWITASVTDEKTGKNRQVEGRLLLTFQNGTKTHDRYWDIAEINAVTGSVRTQFMVEKAPAPQLQANPNSLNLSKLLDEYCMRKVVRPPVTENGHNIISRINGLDLFGPELPGAEDCLAAAVFSARTMNLRAFCAKGGIKVDDLIRERPYKANVFDVKRSEAKEQVVDEKKGLLLATKGRTPDCGLWLKGEAYYIVDHSADRKVWVPDRLLLENQEAKQTGSSRWPEDYPTCHFLGACRPASRSSPAGQSEVGDLQQDLGLQGIWAAAARGFVLVLWWRGDMDVNGGNCRWYLTQTLEKMIESGLYSNIWNTCTA